LHRADLTEEIIKQIEKYNFEVNDIAAIDIDASPVVWAAICVPEEERWNPRTVPECQFSLPYAVATTAFDKDVF
jgi:2-methylcitrate dehydratase PrpD